MGHRTDEKGIKDGHRFKWMCPASNILSDDDRRDIVCGLMTNGGADEDVFGVTFWSTYDLPVYCIRQHFGIPEPEEERRIRERVATMTHDEAMHLFDEISRPANPAESTGNGRIAKGERNATLAQFAGIWRRAGLDAQTIAPALLAVNRERCKPPLADNEVTAIAESIGRYATDGSPPEGKPIQFERMSCAELDQATFRIEYLIDRTLVAGQQCVT